jgi:hypothetical protein
MTSPGNLDIESDLNELPDKVAEALQLWRVATLNREKMEAVLYAGFKASDSDRSATEIKACINASESRYSSVLEEIKCECEYQRLYERLLSAKKRASLRVAF